MSLRWAKVAFCDSAEALAMARRDGLDPDAEILTASPFLGHSAEGRITFLPDRVGPEKLGFFNSLRKGLQADALARCNADQGIRDYAEVMAQSTVMSLDQVVLAAMLTDGDFTEPRSILQTDSGLDFANEQFNGPWSSLLAANDQCVTTVYPAESAARFLWDVEPNRSLFGRIRVAGWRRVLYRIMTRAGLRFSNISGSRLPVFLVVDENELVQETGAALLLRGAELTLVPKPKSGKRESLPLSTVTALRLLADAVFRKRVSGLVPKAAVLPLIASIGDRMIERAEQQRDGKLYYRQVLDRLARKNVRVLSNFPARPSLMAMRQLCQERGIPFVGFQHGVSAEICEDHDSTYSTYESWFCDVALVFNERSVAIGNGLPGRQAETVAVGMPSDFTRTAGAYPFRKEAYPVLFVSTAAYSGYSGKIRYGTQTDRGMLDLEMTLLETVFGRLPHNVLYKTYPALRFIDPAPAADLARRLANVTLFDEFLDLRYLIRRARVLVTMRATSTVSWCLLSDKPLVFIDVEDNMPLRADARDAFQKGVFLFATRDEGWADRLRSFLARPIAEIEREWAEKRDARRDLVANYMNHGRGAGRRAADCLLGQVGLANPAPAR